MATIKLKRRITETADSRFRLRVWVSVTSDNIPSEIFLYQALPYFPEQANVEQFIGICSYADMLNYPINDPVEETPFFRMSYIDLVFTALPVLETKWTFINTSVTSLLNDLASAHIATPETLVYHY